MDTLLLAVFAEVAERYMCDFDSRNLADMAWAFAMAGKPACALLDPISVLDAMIVLGTKVNAIYHKMLV